MRNLFVLLLLLAAGALAERGARYLVIVPDSMAGAVRPLVEWKNAKGMQAKAVPFSIAGSTPDAVRSYIRTAWNDWPVKPEYVLIVGGPAHIRFPSDAYDCRFGDVTGDYHMELGVGRFWVRTVRECSTIVNKTLAYERPMLDDTLWFLSGTTIVREDGDPDDSIYWADSRVCHGYWRQRGYARIDSLGMSRGDSSRHVIAAVNRGTAFITYRGQCGGSWWSPFNALGPFSWTNGRRLPIVFGMTCASIMVETMWSWVSDSMIRAVSPSALGGAVAYFGTTSIANLPEARSTCLRGAMHALYVEGKCRLADVTRHGQAWVDSLFPGQRERYEEWNLLGDPELGVWTGVPRSLVVEHDSAIALGPQDFVVRVRSGGLAVQGAVVCLAMDSVVYVWAETDSSGRATQHIAPTHAGTMTVVVTGRNLLPYQGRCQVGVTGMAEGAGSGSMTELRTPTVTGKNGLVHVEGSVYDMSGREVTGRTAGLAPGVYFVRRSAVSSGQSTGRTGTSGITKVVIAK